MAFSQLVPPFSQSYNESTLERKGKERKEWERIVVLLALVKSLLLRRKVIMNDIYLIHLTYKKKNKKIQKSLSQLKATNWFHSHKNGTQHNMHMHIN